MKHDACEACANKNMSRTMMPCVMCENGNKQEPTVRKPMVETPAVAWTATGILTTATEVTQQRAKQYDQPGGERSMGKAITAFNTITGRNLQESEGWLLMQILKDVRDWQTPFKPHADSLLDGTAYSALKAEARMAGK